mmetsp:Transcript_51220/g.132141  ORF Transcript_51220/g.132141 Transcript_51220/m.132141 type:complete len:208 (-) Transcript_51220:873-1496(-)
MAKEESATTTLGLTVTNMRRMKRRTFGPSVLMRSSRSDGALASPFGSGIGSPNLSTGFVESSFRPFSNTSNRSVTSDSSAQWTFASLGRAGASWVRHPKCTAYFGRSANHSAMRCRWMMWPLKGSERNRIVFFFSGTPSGTSHSGTFASFPGGARGREGRTPAGGGRMTPSSGISSMATSFGSHLRVRQWCSTSSAAFLAPPPIVLL